MDKFEEKLDKIVEKISNIDVTLVKQEAQLQEHIRRSLANEAAVEVLKNELKPVIKHVVQMEAALKLVGILAIILSLIIAVKDLL